MKLCWMIIGNYGLAIILFTLLTKLVLLPISIWIHKNSIKMVKLQPSINFLKANNYGSGDAIAEAQAELFKQEHYHPMLSLIPLAIQIVLLLGVVYIIYHPLGYLFRIPEQTAAALASYIGVDPAESGYQLAVIDTIRSGIVTSASSVPGVPQEALSAVIDSVASLRLGFLGLNLSTIPSTVGGIYLLVPVVAGVSSWFLCWTQNRANVIQHEQGKLSQYGLMVVSVGISLYLGFFVPAGIALYWIASNLFSVAQMYILNAAIDPRKFVDYDALEKSRAALAEMDAMSAVDKKDKRYRENRRRERIDYKRFNHVANKHIVIYSEKSGYYKYFRDLMNELLDQSNLTLHYVTNDPDDAVFQLAKEQPRIRAYYISLKKTAALMMMLDADAIIMTTPDLDKYFLKRSHVRKDIEYIYIPHDMMSVIMSFNDGAFDAFDTIFCTGPHVKAEMRAIEKAHGLAPKSLVEFGYPLAEELLAAGIATQAGRSDHGVREILIAPSWNEDNLLDSCIDILVEKLCSDNNHVTVRPHPEYVKRYPARMQGIVGRFASVPSERLTFELDFSSNRSTYASDLLITDWSGIAAEFCFATLRPAIFVNTKMKCSNEKWKSLHMTPVEIELRSILGVAIEKDRVDEIGLIADELLSSPEKYHDAISAFYDRLIYNHGHAAEVGAEYILERLAEKEAARE